MCTGTLVGGKCLLWSETYTKTRSSTSTLFWVVYREDPSYTSSVGNLFSTDCAGSVMTLRMWVVNSLSPEKSLTRTCSMTNFK